MKRSMRRQTVCKLLVVLISIAPKCNGFLLPSNLVGRQDTFSTHRLTLFSGNEENQGSHEPDENPSRRVALSLLVATVATASTSAQAYDKSFPVELQSIDAGPDARERRVSQIKKQQESERMTALRVKPISAGLWGVALWFLSGSRSSPILTPLANVFYDPEEEQWLRDRNEGLFANVPIPVYIAAAIILFAAGAVTDSVVQVAAGPAISLPLAGVTVVSGAAVELGRLASGDKRVTRTDMERSQRLQQEFDEFVQARLQPGGNCHRQEIVQAFRRYFAKYRNSEYVDEDAENALTDIEIERLIKAWSRMQPGVEMSSSGFYSGVRINVDADVFVKR